MTYASESGDFTIALTGDTMLSRRLTPFDEPAYLKIRETLYGADASFTNLEATVHNPDEGIHDNSVGTMMTTPPGLLGDLRWIGVNMVSTANNHATDFGHEGLVATLRHLDDAGIVHSGSGRHLEEARAPGYLDTRAGRVALVSTNAFFNPYHRAAEQGTQMTGRPGINPLGFTTTYTVDGPAFEQLRAMSRGLGFDGDARRRSRGFFSAAEAGAGGSNEQINFLGRRFRLGDGYDVATSPNGPDMAGNLKWVSEARRQADWVVVSLHCHAFSPRGADTAESNADMVELADFAREFSRAAIDAGADMVVGHGPHISLGVEIHNGKPIFYSLGNFVFQNDTITALPRESFQRFGLDPDATPADFLDSRTDNGQKGFPAHPEYWRSIFAVCRFRNWKLDAVEIHPLDLGFKLPRAQRGRPVIADGKLAEEIIDRTQSLSTFYGTKIECRDGVGQVAL